jgi:prevent-host-death family protein
MPHNVRAWSLSWGLVVATVGIRAFKAQATALVTRAENGEPIIVSRRGRPVAVMLPLEMDLQTLLWAQSPELAIRRAQATESLLQGEAVEITSAADFDRALEDARDERLLRAQPISAARTTRPPALPAR